MSLSILREHALAGTVVAGFLATWAVPAVAQEKASPPIFSPNLTVALIAAIGPTFVAASFVGPAYAMAQALVPLRMRARSAAILLFVLNIIGLGTAAPIVGKISDLLEPIYGADALRYALMTGIITGLIGAVCYWRASLTLKDDIARVVQA